MSIDNIVAVAAIARDNTTLLVFGLALAIAFMAFFAGIIMRIMLKYSIGVVPIGAGSADLSDRFIMLPYGLVDLDLIDRPHFCVIGVGMQAWINSQSDKYLIIANLNQHKLHIRKIFRYSMRYNHVLAGVR